MFMIVNVCDPMQSILIVKQIKGLVFYGINFEKNYSMD